MTTKLNVVSGRDRGNTWAKTKEILLNYELVNTGSFTNAPYKCRHPIQSKACFLKP